ncbi:MAG: hypothetical protein H6Q41_864 [Deltaproteobacteria bacterium]|jgi:hypothetical protein|nr:hypothetical protein [Deltaproteobacteria bacterium]
MSHNLEKRWEAADEPKADDLLTGDEVLASQGIRSLCGSRRRSRHTIKIYAILIVMAAIAVSLFFGTAKASDIVTFKSTSTTADGTPLILAGKLTKPQAAGPFPAIVLLHECAGIAPYQDVWAERFSSWGMWHFRQTVLDLAACSPACVPCGRAPHRLAMKSS